MDRQSSTLRYSCFLLLLVALPYQSGLKHDWVYDDHGTILENEFLQDFSNIRKVLTLQTMGDPDVIDGQRPVLLLTMFTDRWIWGERAAGFRLTNLLLHLAAVLGFYRIAKRWLVSIPNRSDETNLDGLFAGSYAGSGDPAYRDRSYTASAADQRLPFWLALIFGLHPVLTEAVQAPSFREDVLALFFVLGFLGIRSAGAGRPGSILLQLLFLAGALGSKESAVCAPFILLAVWWLIPAERPGRARGWLIAGLSFALTAGWTLWAYMDRPVQAVGVRWNGRAFNFPENMLTAPWLALKYFWLFIKPFPLSVDRVLHPVSDLNDPRLWCGFIFITTWVVAFFLWRKKQPLPALGMVWLVCAFIPVSNLVPLLNPAADRYLYGMAPGWCLLLAGVIRWLPFKREFCGFRMYEALFVLLIVLYAAGIQHRLKDWKNDKTLWTAVLQAEPESARAHTWVGLSAKREGRRDEAADYFRQAYELNTNDPAPLVNLAILAGEAGDLFTAESLLWTAVDLAPDRAEAQWNLGRVLQLQGLESESDIYYSNAVRLKPSLLPDALDSSKEP